MKKILFYSLAISLLVSCKNTGKKQAGIQPIQEMIIDQQGGAADITLHINTIDKLGQDITRYKILSTYKDQPVGFWLLVTKGKDKQSFVSNGVTFLAMGDTSNNFLTALTDLYKVKQIGTIFKDSITVTYADLAALVDTGKPGNWAAAQAKLFFTTDDDNPELFLNVDEENHTISLPEKDPEYRQGIIQALSKNKQ